MDKQTKDPQSTTPGQELPRGANVLVGSKKLETGDELCRVFKYISPDRLVCVQDFSPSPGETG